MMSPYIVVHRVVLCRIRLFPTMISKMAEIKWFWSELPLILLRHQAFKFSRIILVFFSRRFPSTNHFNNSIRFKSWFRHWWVEQIETRYWIARTKGQGYWYLSCSWTAWTNFPTISPVRKMTQDLPGWRYKELEREVGKPRNCKLQVGKLELKLGWMKLETLYCIENFPTSICTFQLIWKLFNFKLTNLKVSNSFFSNSPFQLHISPGLGLGDKCSLKKKLEKIRSWKVLSWKF